LKAPKLHVQIDANAGYNPRQLGIPNLKALSPTIRNSALLGLAALMLQACSSGPSLGSFFGKGSDTEDDISAAAALDPNAATPDDNQVAKIYNDALSSMRSGNYKTANKKFADVERRYPYSKWATKSILMQAFSSYQGRSYGESISSAQRFIALHPGHKDTPYAYYLVGLSEYDQIRDVRRDQSQTQRALDALEEVERRYPDSKYAKDSRRKAMVARDALAAKEMEVGRYYLKKGSYAPAINRYKKVVTDYQQTSHTPEALYRLAESYMALGVSSEARTAAAVLGHNFPKSTWYRDAYTLVASDGRAPVADEGSWISKAFRGITG
jgi:outer membrane protein assembly factor BamD